MEGWEEVVPRIEGLVLMMGKICVPSPGGVESREDGVPGPGGGVGLEQLSLLHHEDVQLVLCTSSSRL